MKKKLIKSTKFSDFIRNATFVDRKRVYTKVIERATKIQSSILSRNLK